MTGKDMRAHIDLARTIRRERPGYTLGDIGADPAVQNLLDQSDKLAELADLVELFIQAQSDHVKREAAYEKLFRAVRG